MQSESPKQSLALALAIHRKNAKKMAKGGVIVGNGADQDDEGADDMIVCGPSSIASAIRAKRMAAGGEVNDDFLSDEEDTELPDESEAPDMKKSRLLSKAFENIRKRK